MNESWGSSPDNRGDLRIFDAALVAWATLRDRVIADAAALPSALDELSARAAASLKVSGAGIVVAANSGGRRVVVGACDNRVPRLTMLQDTFDEGPSVDAFVSGGLVGEPDLTRSEVARWPSFGPAAVAAGVAAVFSFPLTAHSPAVGTLDCYRVRAGALSPALIAGGRLLADIAVDLIVRTAAAGGVDAVVGQTVDAGSDRARVEQARAMIAYRLGVSLRTALERMRDHARRRGLGLDEVADMIIDGRLQLDT